MSTIERAPLVVDLEHTSSLADIEASYAIPVTNCPDDALVIHAMTLAVSIAAGQQARPTNVRGVQWVTPWIARSQENGFKKPGTEFRLVQGEPEVRSRILWRVRYHPGNTMYEERLRGAETPPHTRYAFLPLYRPTGKAAILQLHINHEVSSSSPQVVPNTQAWREMVQAVLPVVSPSAVERELSRLQAGR